MMKRILWGISLLVLTAGSAQAALLSRLSGQAYYDDVLNITWLQNANLADTNTFGVGGINPSGAMTWAKANEWIAAMNTAAYLGVSNWRLPTVNPVDGSAFDYTNLYDGSSDRGYNISALGSAYPGSTGSEMAHMFYSTLGNSAAYNTSGVDQPCRISLPPYCLTSTSPFSNLQPEIYWSGTTYAPSTSSAWLFNFGFGGQGGGLKSTNLFYAWAVSPGDIDPVPVPGAVWLFSSALAVMGALRRRAVAGKDRG
jgi:hypothetical protein